MLCFETSYPFQDDRYVLIELECNDGTVMGSIEGIPNMISIKVEEPYRRRGYGRSLVNEFKKHFLSKEKDTVFLAEVDRENSIARRFWSSCGFVEAPDEDEVFLFAAMKKQKR